MEDYSMHSHCKWQSNYLLISTHTISVPTVGQFWGVNFTVVPFTGDYYTLTMSPENAPTRSFIAHMGNSTWTLKHVPAIPNSKCFYVGNGQGGRDPLSNNSAIEGDWTDYITTGLYDTKWKYNQYTEDTCP